MIAEEREKNPDGSTACGVFLPLPYNIAKDFPKTRGSDDSVPHITVLYAGDLCPDSFEKFVKVVKKALRRVPPFETNLTYRSMFTNREGELVYHMRPNIHGSMGLSRLHGHLRRACEAEGLKLGHAYGPYDSDDLPYEARYKPHATIAYAPRGTLYRGPKPNGGAWRVTEIEVWGHERIRLPLGKTVTNQPIGLTRIPLCHVYPRAVRESATSLVKGERHPAPGGGFSNASGGIPRMGKLRYFEFMKKLKRDPLTGLKQEAEHVDKLPGGLADKNKPSDFDPKQLAMGIKVELEHTKDRKLAREIAMDHLKEDPRYYTKLKKIEPHHESVMARTPLRGI